MIENSKMIITLCGRNMTSVQAKPYSPREWHIIAMRLMSLCLQPTDIANLTQADIHKFKDTPLSNYQRLSQLLSRKAEILASVALDCIHGIMVITRADSNYPLILKRKLPTSCPPVLYCLGNLELLKNPMLGIVGSRQISIEESAFIRSVAKRAGQQNMTIVSGGASGSDRIAESACLCNGGNVVSFVAEPFKANSTAKTHSIEFENGKLLLLSANTPKGHFTASIALERNAYIYASSYATVVSKSAPNKGGTWNGATKALHKRLCPIVVDENSQDEGIVALRELGAQDVPFEWDLSLTNLKHEEQFSFDGGVIC